MILLRSLRQEAGSLSRQSSAGAKDGWHPVATSYPRSKGCIAAHARPFCPDLEQLAWNHQLALLLHSSTSKNSGCARSSAAKDLLVPPRSSFDSHQSWNFVLPSVDASCKTMLLHAASLHAQLLTQFQPVDNMQAHICPLNTECRPHGRTCFWEQLAQSAQAVKGASCGEPGMAAGHPRAMCVFGNCKPKVARTQKKHSSDGAVVV